MKTLSTFLAVCQDNASMNSDYTFVPTLTQAFLPHPIMHTNGHLSAQDSQPQGT
ncbi:hypothetical protein [Allocoleopsis sp.]|uniref:hypothetical protein n=1 Tax=Allocoleopsis sp. TaxID=3088169 RepID=UPI002FD41B1F